MVEAMAADLADIDQEALEMEMEMDDCRDVEDNLGDQSGDSSGSGSNSNNRQSSSSRGPHYSGEDNSKGSNSNSSNRRQFHETSPERSSSEPTARQSRAEQLPNNRFEVI